MDGCIEITDLIYFLKVYGQTQIIYFINVLLNGYNSSLTNNIQQTKIYQNIHFQTRAKLMGKVRHRWRLLNCSSLIWLVESVIIQWQRMSSHRNRRRRSNQDGVPRWSRKYTRFSVNLLIWERRPELVCPRTSERLIRRLKTEQILVRTPVGRAGTVWGAVAEEVGAC